MADTVAKKTADKTPKEEVVEETPTWAETQDFMQKHAKAMYGSPYSTSSKRGYGYYGQTAEPARKKALATTLGISTAGAVVEGLISASRMFDSGIKYAERELAEAEGIQREPTPKMTEDEKYEIRTASLAPARAEAAEIKSDVGALMASRGGATVADLLRVRESGTETLATAGLEAEAAIGKKELQGQQKHDQRVQMAQQRADQMTQTLFEARQEGRDHKAGLIRDITKVAAEVAAEWPSEDDRPAMDRMLEGNMTMEEITKIHEKAVYSAFRPGTHAYNTYMMAAYSDWKEKQPEPTERTAEVPVAAQPAAPGAKPNMGETWEITTGGYAGRKATVQKDGSFAVEEPDGRKVRVPVNSSEYASILKQWQAPTPAPAPAPAPVDVSGQAKAITQIQQGFSADETADLYSLADKAGLKKEDYTFERAIKPTGDEAPKWQPVSNESLGGDPIYRIKLNEGVELSEAPAPAPVEEQVVEPTKFETHEKFWTGPDQGRKEADGFRVWVRGEYPAYTSKVPEMGGMDGDDNAGLSSSGSFNSKNATFSAVWDKHGAEYLKWKATQSTAK